MQRVADIMLKRFARNNRGAVIVEFAFALPVFLLLYTGGYCLSDMIACRRKVIIATRSLVDIVSRTTSPAIIYNDPQSVNAKSYLSASAVVLSPYKLNNATEQISLLRVCDATHAYVVWTQAQTQNADGSTVTATTSEHTAGTLPKNEAQTASTVVSIPGNMISTTMVPTSPDGSNVCSNLAPGTNNKTQVGTAGGWLYMSKITYNFTPTVSFIPIGTKALTHTIYMAPRLY
ncbi:TadE/TadG family type IV pilus assembly protein [Sphingobium sp. CCH11-B1]|jgi:Flp pilus assembly protein TadG|uniref:TadE/TadG family type IV pilus assembly protein n=1 Tax=Sphingobium sp. CCH11-B1 TaxID=1768781 RepID=UPI0008333ECA|nr:TadE/TadG family type IV pilus assembly protein [Sphingobium sp. CCH11-B1]MEA3389893.1 TadE/TadG family type IV pilus assembly protein [Pseudomonadota bacterium]